MQPNPKLEHIKRMSAELGKASQGRGFKLLRRGRSVKNQLLRKMKKKEHKSFHLMMQMKDVKNSTGQKR
jgi:hypothetical protein